MSRRQYQTMRRQRFDFIIIDEAHHSMASGYQKLWEMFPNSKILGVTATPWRMNHSGFLSLFGDIVLAPSVEWFVRQGYLANYDYISIKRSSQLQRDINAIDRYGVDGDYLEAELSALFDKGKIRAELYKSYKKYAEGKKGIIYAIDRQHAANICSLYASHGVRICMVDGTTPAAERQQMIDLFKEGKIQVIVNVNIFSEGFDCPDIEFIQLARPTKSLSLYLQQVGRGLRISANKERSIILDNVGLYNRFGTPMANRRWRYHFDGHDGGEGFNDGTGIRRDVAIVEREFNPDYSEDDEEMLVVEHADGKDQRYADDALKSMQLGDYNVFRQNGLYGVCDRKNRILIPPIYEDMHPYCNGYIPFKQDGLWGIMLKNGTVKVRAKYFWIGPFEDGVAEVRNTSESDLYHINCELERI
jgi:superfamily II DNA or RNA helicase